MAFTPGFKKLVGLVCAIAVVGSGIYAYKQGMFAHGDHAHADAPLSAASLQPGAPPVRIAQPDGYVASDNTLNAIRDNGIVRVSVENPSEPFFSETNDIPRGFNVEFAQLLFSDPSFSSPDKPIAVDARHQTDNYADVPEQLLQVDEKRNHIVDIAMDGLTFADNMPAGVVYSMPYVDDFGYALIVKNGSSIRTVGDLAGKTIGILKGDPDVKAFVMRMYPGSRIVEIDDADAQFVSRSIDSGVADAFIYDYPFAVSSIKGTDLRFAISKLDGSSVAYKIGVRAQDQELLIYLNAAIAKAKTSPAYLALLRKYFVSDQIVSTAASGAERTYTVRTGDTLNLIATSQLGSGNRYRDIQARNNLANPNLILVGQALVIPAH